MEFHLAALSINDEKTASPTAVAPTSALVPSCQFSDAFIMPQGEGFWCSLCNLELKSPYDVETHVAGSKHSVLQFYHPMGSSYKGIGTENPTSDLSIVNNPEPGSSSDKGIGTENLKSDLSIVNNPESGSSSDMSIGAENTKSDSSYNPEDIWNLYSDFKFSFHGICVENVLEGVKLFGVNDPIIF